MAGMVVQMLAQSLPVGLPVVEDYLRRQQLLGDSTYPASLMIRPSYGYNDYSIGSNSEGYVGFGSSRTGNADNQSVPAQINSRGNASGAFVLRAMPLVWKQQYISDHPIMGLNDGAMIPARGYQTLVSGGFFARLGILSLQLMPEFVYAQNLPFDGLPHELNNKVWSVYNSVKNVIDLPDRFGEEPYRKVFWGQSSLRLTYKSLSLGVSNENLWWGPGTKNTLLMTNNAPGFKHITLNTVKPIVTPIGKFEGQIVGGRLDNSGFPGVDSVSLAQHGIRPRQKRDEWRYINAMTVTYEPRWIPGLTLGGVRSFTIYNGSITDNYRTYLPLLEPLLKISVGAPESDTIPSDQIASVFARWVMPESHSEVYLEYGRADHSWDMTDFILEPGHYRAYVLGLRKLVPLVRRKNEYIDIHLEITELGRNLISSLRKANNPAVWYIHGQVRHGYTHNGQILGSGIGTSSNMQSLNISWVKDYKRIGFELHRLAHDEDLWAYMTQNTGYGDYRTHWTDVGGAFVADWNFRNLLVNFKFQTIGSINYKYFYDPIPSDPPFWWDRGPVRYNMHAALSLVYLLSTKKH